MSVKLKLTQIGTSTGIVVPKEMLVRLKVAKGDELFLTETPSGYLLTPYDPEIEEQLELGREFMSEYRETFRALAK
jgi:putative addiction module antidote